MPALGARRRHRAVTGRARAVALGAVVMLGVAGWLSSAGAAVARADSRVSIAELSVSDYGSRVAPSLSYWKDYDNDDGDDNITPSQQFRDDAQDAQTDSGAPVGNTPFTCPLHISGCVNQTNAAYTPAYGTYVLRFTPDSGSSPGLDAGETLTLQAPAGTVFPSTRADYVVGSQCGTKDVVPPPIDDPPIIPQEFRCDNGGYEPDAIRALAPNKVSVTMPFAIGDDDEAALFVAHVVNPPEGTYSPLDYPVTTDEQPVFGFPPAPDPDDPDPGFEFGSDGAFVEENSSLVASADRVRVSLQNGVTLTSTIRDAYGNGIGGEDVAIEPVAGAATQISGQAETQDDGTLTADFVDTTAEVDKFRASIETALLPALAVVTYTPGPPDAGHSEVSVSPATVAADGTSESLVTVDAADEFGNPVIEPADPDAGTPIQGDQLFLQAQPTSSRTFAFQSGKARPIGSTCDPAPVVAGTGCATTTATIDVSGSAVHVARTQFALADTAAEDVTFGVFDFTQGASLTTGPFSFVTHFVAGPPVAARSQITATAQPVVADGVATAAITVTLKDAQGNPVPGLQVALTQGAGGLAMVSPATATSDAGGQAVFHAADAHVQGVPFTAAYSGSVMGQPVSGSVPVAPAPGPTVGFVAGNASATASTVVASPASTLAGSKGTSAVTVTLVDGGGHAAGGRTVSLTQPTGQHSTITPATATTGVDGVATFAVGDATVESVTYTAADATDGVTLASRPTVAFTSTPSVGRSSLSASPASVPADGTTSSTVTVALLDSGGHAVAGKQACLTQAIGTLPSSAPCPTGGLGPSTAIAVRIPDASSGCAVQAAAGTTDCNGRAAFSVTASMVSNVTYGVVDLADYPAGPALGPSAAVTFTQPASEASASTVTADPTRVLAGAPAASTVTVTLIGPAGTPLADHQVALHASSATSTVTAVDATTDADGDAQFAVADPAVESVTYSAADLTASPNVTIEQQPTVVFIPDEAAQSTVTASSASATADGGATAGGIDYVTVTLDPDQPLAGDRVSLAQPSSAHSSISPVQIPDATSGCATQAPASTSDCRGQARFKVSDATIETVSLTANDATIGLRLAQFATIAFVAPPPVVSGLSPDAGLVAGGKAVAITGTSLVVGGQTPSVKFGAVAASKVSCSASTACTATAPAVSGPGQVEVRVTTSVGVSTPATTGSDVFTYLGTPPAITQISPTSGPTSGGTVITLRGTNLGAAGVSTVHFGTTTVVPASVDAGQASLTVVAPASAAGTVDITVTTAAGTSAKSGADRFTYKSSR